MHVDVIKSQALKQPFTLYDLLQASVCVPSRVMLSSPRESVHSRLRSRTKIGCSNEQAQQPPHPIRPRIELHKSRHKLNRANCRTIYVPRVFTEGRHARCYLHNIASLSLHFAKQAHAMSEKKKKKLDVIKSHMKLDKFRRSSSVKSLYLTKKKKIYRRKPFEKTKNIGRTSSILR